MKASREVVFVGLLSLLSLFARLARADWHPGVYYKKPPATANAPSGTPSDGGNYNGYIEYQGGPIVQQPKVATVFWNAAVGSQIQTNVPAFYSALTGGAFMHFVSEYSIIGSTIVPGSVIGHWTLSPAHTSSILNDSDIASELSAQIATGFLPPADANTIYMVHFPPGITIVDQFNEQSCVDFCAYHTSSNGVIYGVIPDASGGCAPGPPGCQNSATGCCGDQSNPFDDLTTTASHELMESITDPMPLTNTAWSTPFVGEIGDLCNFSVLGDKAYNTVDGPDGTVYQSQRGFSDAAYRARMPAGSIGCVTYPNTSLCCSDLAASCSWLPPGSTNCPMSGSTFALSVLLPTLDGSGYGSMTLRENPFGGYFGAGVNALWENLPGGGSHLTYVGTIATNALIDAPASVCFNPSNPSNTSETVWVCAPAPSSGNCPQGQVYESSPNYPQALCCTDSAPSPGKNCLSLLSIPTSSSISAPATPRWLVAWLAVTLVGLGGIVSRRAYVGVSRP